MKIALKNSTIDKYFRFLDKLDNISKKRLIIKLINSIEVKEKKHFDLNSLFGEWDDSRSSDEMINDIKKKELKKINRIILNIFIKKSMLLIKEIRL